MGWWREWARKIVREARHGFVNIFSDFAACHAGRDCPYLLCASCSAEMTAPCIVVLGVNNEAGASEE